MCVNLLEWKINIKIHNDISIYLMDLEYIAIYIWGFKFKNGYRINIVFIFIYGVFANTKK